jgi:hypothetical protein
VVVVVAAAAVVVVAAVLVLVSRQEVEVRAVLFELPLFKILNPTD